MNKDSINKRRDLSLALHWTALALILPTNITVHIAPQAALVQTGFAIVAFAAAIALAPKGERTL